MIFCLPSTKKGIRMFFKVEPKELNRTINNLNAQRELLARQLQDGSISREQWQEEQKRLSSLISSYTDNMLSAIQDQQTNHSP